MKNKWMMGLLLLGTLVQAENIDPYNTGARYGWADSSSAVLADSSAEAVLAELFLHLMQP